MTIIRLVCPPENAGSASGSSGNNKSISNISSNICNIGGSSSSRS